MISGMRYLLTWFSTPASIKPMERLKNIKNLILLLIVVTFIVVGSGSYILWTNWKKASIPSRIVSKVTHQTSVLQPLPTNASDKERESRSGKLRASAVETNTISLMKNCDLSPTVARAKKDQLLTINNKDNKKHKLIIIKDHVISLEPNGSATFSLDFLKQLGMYALRCDDGSAVHGYLFLVE